MRATLLFRGTLQGTGFPGFVFNLATANSLTGFLQPHADGTVEIQVSGWEKSIEKFVDEIGKNPPPNVIIDRMTAAYSGEDGPWTKFKIYPGDEQIEEPGSNIPSDYAICKHCENEIRDPRDRRYQDPFITCNECGPRYSVSYGLPFNREKTTYRDILACASCRREQSNPDDRRYAHQTISCPQCGPRLMLTNNANEFVGGDPIATAARLINEGALVAIQGFSGFHVFCDASNESAVQKLRLFKHTRYRPIPVMVPRIENLVLFAELSSTEKALISSQERPIVILKKMDPFPLSSELSPGLDTVGVMLPVLGLHILLLDHIRSPALAFTSGNPIHEPLIAKPANAIQRLTGVDYFLTHELPIAGPLDDSIARIINGHRIIIRRSRGYAPQPIKLKWKTEEAILGLGSTKQTASCYFFGDYAFLTPSYGDLATHRTQKEITAATQRLVEMVSIPPSIIAYSSNRSDTHATTAVVNTWTQEYGAKTMDIPHDVAHIVALANEYHLNNI
ncbi:MAG: Sua5/YciO/YrdC/YwlC family protein, partial [Candidatus Ranarchaeia archaeon]